MWKLNRTIKSIDLHQHLHAVYEEQNSRKVLKAQTNVTAIYRNYKAKIIGKSQSTVHAIQ